MLVAFHIVQGSLYFGNVFEYGKVVAAVTGLSVLFCGDVAYELCGVVIVWDPFGLGE